MLDRFSYLRKEIPWEKIHHIMVMIKKLYTEFVAPTQLDYRKLMNAYGKHQLKDQKTKEIKIKIIFPNETTKSITIGKNSITYDLYG